MKWVGFALGLSLLLVPVSGANGSTIEIRFEGTVKSVTDAVAGGSFEIGVPVTGRIVFENEGLHDRSPEPRAGYYYGEPPFPVKSFSVTIGDYTAVAATPNGDNGLTVYDYFLSSPMDWFVAASPMTADAVNGLVPRVAVFGLFTVKDRISGDEVPTVEELLAFQEDLIEINEGGLQYLSFRSPTGNAHLDRVNWTLDHYTVVPEPAVLSTVAMTLFALYAVRRAARITQGIGPAKRSSMPPYTVARGAGS